MLGFISKIYIKPKSLLRSERICKNCNLQCIENEFHFLSRCPLYETERTVLYSQINHVSNNFNSLNDLDKAKWLLTQEDQNILVALGTYVHIGFEKRKKNMKLISV